MQDILQAFEGSIEPVQTTWIYRVGIVIVTIAMLLLPVLYLLLIAAVGALVFYHAFENASMVPKLRNFWAILFVYVGPIIVGCVLLFFMVKPLFAKQSKSQKLRTLEFGEEPLLFALVTRVAKAVGAPEPKQIDINAEANASASFGAGLSGLFGQNLVLTLGLPLVGTFNVDQLAGVVAHELGHFSQTAGMRLTYIIRSINFWFARIVYERDDWDDALVRGCEAGDRFSLILYLAMFCVWITRCILWVFMAVGHGISCFMLRQMEYDADRFEIRLAGSATFVSIFKRLMVLDAGMNAANMLTFHAIMSSSKLPDDFAALAQTLTDGVSPENVKEIAHETETSKTGLFDTHPSTGDRIRAARREKAPGVFHMDQPASQLFRDFRRTSKAVTGDYYRNIFGRRVTGDTLVSVKEFLGSDKK